MVDSSGGCLGDISQRFVCFFYTVCDVTCTAGRWRSRFLSCERLRAESEEGLRSGASPGPGYPAGTQRYSFHSAVSLELERPEERRPTQRVLGSKWGRRRCGPLEPDPLHGSIPGTSWNLTESINTGKSRPFRANIPLLLLSDRLLTNKTTTLER